MLDASKSSYLAPFEVLSRLIQRGSDEANDNLKFLNMLTDQCLQLAAAEPKDIPAILLPLLSRVRVVGAVSRFYRSDERLGGLIRRISNEIIRRCCKKISVDDALDGDVMSVVDAVNDSIDCCLQWRAVYAKVVAMTAMAHDGSRTGAGAGGVGGAGAGAATGGGAGAAAALAASMKLRGPPRGAKWGFEETAIFAQVDAFVERCRNLMDVCEGQVQFARKSLRGNGGAKAPLPVFGGSRGPEIAQSLLGVEQSFEGHIDKLRPLKNEILDVKAVRWHDANNAFKSGLRDLGVFLSPSRVPAPPSHPLPHPISLATASALPPLPQSPTPKLTFLLSATQPCVVCLCVEGCVLPWPEAHARSPAFTPSTHPHPPPPPLQRS